MYLPRSIEIRQLLSSPNKVNQPGLSHQNLQVSPRLRQTNSYDRCSHPCEQRSSTHYCPEDFDGTALEPADPKVEKNYHSYYAY